MVGMQKRGDTKMLKRPRGTACVHCRQMKLKCDAHETFPAPCSRCTSTRLSCSVNPSFIRVGKRDRLDALERQIRELRNSRTDQMTSASQQLPEADAGSVNTSSDISGRSVLPAAIPLDMTGTITSKVLEAVEVGPGTILSLFEEYYTYYHPRLPILPDLMKALRVSESCPLLFWTVIAIASKESKEHSYLYPTLVDPVRRLANDIHSLASKSVPFIQALLLLCTWPFPFTATILDRSWSYCGTATHIALELGLHRPRHISDFLWNATIEEDTLLIRTKTWLACFIVNYNISAKLGVPSTIKLDDVILETVGDEANELLGVLEHQVLIAYHSDKAYSILERCTDSAVGSHFGRFAVIRSLDRDFAMMESQLSPSWSYQTEVTFLTARLMLYSFAMIGIEKDLSSDPLQIDNASEFTTLVYSTAVRLLWKISSSPTEVPYWTSKITSSVFHAMVVLLKVIEPLDQHNVEKIAAKNSISQVYSLLRSRSVMDEDHESRLCDVLEFLSTDGDQRNNQLPEKIRSRMAASLVYEAIWRAKTRFESGRLYRTQLENVAPGVQSSMNLPDWDQLSFQNVDHIIAGWDTAFDPSF